MACVNERNGRLMIAVDKYDNVSKHIQNEPEPGNIYGRPEVFRGHWRANQSTKCIASVCFV